MKRFIKRNESGAVSILTVVFFVLFLSVLSVSFLKVVNDERQRSLSNELSNLALTAAEAGVEDGKRVLLYCLNNPDKEDCKALLAQTSNGNCDFVLNSFGSASDANIIETQPNENGLIEGKAEQGEKYQQYYTCLGVQNYTSNVEFALSAVDTKSPDASASVIVPLDVAKEDNNGAFAPIGALQSFTLNWHLVSGDLKYGDGQAATLSSDTNNPRKDSWTGPAMVRVEMVRVPNGGFSNDDLVNNTYAVTLRPSASSTAATTVSLSDYAPSRVGIPNEAQTPLVDAKCGDQTTLNENYQCSVPITYDNGIALSSNQYYVKITAIYRDTHISLSNLTESSGGAAGQVYFNGVQPLIDVTGRVNNTYRRVLARVAPNAAMAGDMYFPEYTIESATKVCKKMRIVAAGSEPGSADLCLSD